VLRAEGKAIGGLHHGIGNVAVRVFPLGALPFPPEHPAQKAGAQHEHQQHDAHRRQQIPPEKARKGFHERTSPASL
jgi:hypothetical protein